jgi:hypothetical protein
MTIFRTDTIMLLNLKMEEVNLQATWVSKKERKLMQKVELLADQ